MSTTSPATSPGGDLTSLVDALRRYSEAADRVTASTGAHHGVHRTDLRALTVLMQRQAGGQHTSPSDLGRLLNLSSASTTALVDRLVANGHAERTRSETDRRRVLVRHTDTAVHEGRAIFGPLAARLSSHLEGFSPGQMGTAAAVLREATAAMLEVEEDLRSTALRDPR